MHGRAWLGNMDLVEPYYLGRSEEHTSELQSPCNLVCRLLLEKKNKHLVPRRPARPRMWARRITPQVLATPPLRGAPAPPSATRRLSRPSTASLTRCTHSPTCFYHSTRGRVCCSHLTSCNVCSCVRVYG